MLHDSLCEHRSRHRSRCSEQSRTIYIIHNSSQTLNSCPRLLRVCNLVCVHTCELISGCVFTLDRAFLSLMSISFTSLALGTSHTSEVTSKHASSQPGVIKSSRQWKTGEETWLNGSRYSYWCLTHQCCWFHVNIFTWIINIWTLLFTCGHLLCLF